MNQLHSARSIATAVGAILFLSATISQAQSVSAPAAAPSAGDALEEVIVTAERRSESLQQVAIAATAVSGEDLQSDAVVRVADLQDIAPGLSVTNTGLVENVNIRGIGIASGDPSVANGVATYIDGVFQPPIVAANEFFDIADIEVLRGPQGTLVGSNSTGGAIFINSQNPTFDRVKGYAQVGYGNFDATTGQGAINLPASDTLAFRLAGNYDYHDSPYQSIGPIYTNAGSLNDKSGRIGMLWKPGSFQLLAKIEMVDRNTGGYAYSNIPGTVYAPFTPANPYVLDYDSPTENHERGLISTVEMRYSFADGITLRSLSGYQDKNIHNLYDSDGTAENTPLYPQETEDQYVREREWTEEVNLISPTGDKSNWVTGAYLQRNIIGVNIEQGDFPTHIFSPEFKTTTGIFGQYNYKFSPEFELQTGLRYSTYVVAQEGSVDIGAGIPGFPPGGLQVANLASDHHDGRPTGKIDLNYTPDQNNLYYVFVARGYKAGGANSSISSFGPETVWDYEAGWKLTLPGGHFRSQLGAFYYSYDDFQFNVLNPVTTQNNVLNLPTATLYGAEGQFQFQAAGWRANAGFAYVHSQLPGIPGGFINARLLPAGTLGPQCAAGVASNPPTCFDYGPYTQTASSGPNLFSPEWTYNFGVEYKAALGGESSLTPRVNVSYVGPQWTSVSYSPVTDYLPGYTLVSALLTLELPSAWQVQAYSDNLFDKVYIAGQGANDDYYGQPRTFGIRVHKSF
jgi:iron complex outermembrane receptor protein